MLICVSLNELYFTMEALGSMKMESAFSGGCSEPGVSLPFQNIFKIFLPKPDGAEQRET